jgi:hypothetical protein
MTIVVDSSLCYTGTYLHKGEPMKRAMSVFITVLIVITMAGCSIPAATDTTPPISPAATADDTTAAVLPTPTATLSAAATPTAPEGTPVPTLTPKPEPLPDPLTITERTLVYSNDYIYVNIRYPEISGMADEAAQSGINEQVYANLQDKAHEIESSSEEDAASSPHAEYSIDSNYQIKRNDGGILSIRINISYYNGGANTGSDCAFINVINTNPAQQPALENLFAPGADYTTVLNERISTLIAADPYGSDYNFESVSSSQWYYLTDTSLVIVFERYTIAPGAAGEPEFAIPLSELSDILIPELL